ncbi:MAG: HAMP domain-containing histidine kinase [Candidatus Levybacteria bacterium]|nr:HAMP domain-containing histidine kinase [Candidatus Levybacteria bacterium]
MPLFLAILGLIIITIFFYIILSKQEKEKIEFFHVMVHRFRSPISIIRWYIELLSDKSVGNLNDKQEEYFTEIYNASEKLNETIESLIVLLQLEAGNISIKTETVNVKEMVGKILKELQLKIERHKLHLEEIYPTDREVIIQVDPKLLGIALQNLIENAIRYTPENGNVSIKAVFSDKKLFIEIKDSGYGIPKEHKSKILADSVNSKDMGFSLYLIKRILKKMNAQIDFKSEENKGTTFFISLPANA